MIRKNKAVACLMLITMLLSGIPEGFGIVSDVYAAETAASAEEAEGPEAPEENVTGTMSADSGTEDKPETAAQTPGAEDPDEANPSGDGEKITEGQGSAPGQGTDEKSSGTVEATDKKEDTPAGQGKETDEQASVAPKEEQNGEQKDTQEDVRKEESQKDNDTVKTEKEYPAFKQSKTVNGVIVTVEADAGVFPENARLSVTSVPSSETEKEVKEERDADQNVAVSYTFDIKVLDKNGNELQPAEDQNVKVSFRTAEVADPNLEVSVYHISEDGEGAEELDVDVSGQTAVAESDGFSYYTVEFTYNNLQYVLNGGESVPLSEILSAVGLVGEATEVTVSNSELFSASKKDDKWIITAHKAFNSEEWMRVIINGAVYEITVTDNQAASDACGNGLTWTLENGTLTISKTGEGNGKMTDWGNISNVPWKENKNDIYNVVIGDGVTTIGINAFYECVNLTSVKIPSTVTSIGEGAFYKCSSLTSVDIAASSNLTSIGRTAFYECSSLASIEIPSGVTSIGRAAFFGCTKLEFAVLKGTIDVDGSGEHVFENCDKLLVYYRGDNFDEVKSKFSIPNMTNTFTIPCNIENREYNGSAYNPKPATVKYGSTVSEDCYILSYQKLNDITWSNVKPDEVKDVGTYHVVVTGKPGTYYAGLTASSVSFSIDPRSVTITAASEQFTYDGTVHSNSNYNVDGLIGSDAIRAVVEGSITFPSKGSVANEVKSYEFTTGTAGNYTVSTVDGALTMVNAKRPITITAASAKKTYDGTALTNNTVTVTSGDLFSGDTLVAEATGSATNVADTAPGNNPIAEGYKVMHGTEDVTNNYNITAVAGTLTINPKDATVTAQDKAFAYNGKPQSWPEYDVTGLVEGDAITAMITGSITTPNESPVVNKVASYEFTTGTPGNYNVTTKNGQLTMSNASYAITITAGSSEKTYDGKPLTNNTVTITLGNLAEGDSLVATTTGSATNVTDTAFGNNPVAPGYKVMHGNTDVTANYAITTVAGTLTINPKDATVTAQDKAFAYNGKPQSWPEYDVTGLVEGDAITAMITGSITTPNESPVVNKVASYEFTTGTPGNYNVTTQNGQLTMSNALYAITITAGSSEKTYDGKPLTNNTVTITLGNLAEGDSLVATTTGSATNVTDTAFGNNPVAPGYKVMHGNNDVTASYAITTVAGKLTINPKSVTVKAQDKTFTYDGKPHSWPKYDVTGLVGSDEITATITGSITFPSERPVANEVKSYEFTTGTAGNYTVTTQNGQLTMTNVSQAITITAGSASKTYDGTALTNNTITVTSGDLFSGDTLVAEATGSATNVADTAPGNNPIAEGYKVMHGNTDVTANYAITTVNGTLTITPRPATVKARDKMFTYDGKPHSYPVYDVDGLVGNDKITATVTGSITFPSEGSVANEVESYEFTTGTPGNYEVTTQNGQLTMTQNPVCTITFYANNGTGATREQDAERGATVSLKQNDFTYAGYTFKEWNDKADGSGKSYSDKESVTVNEDMSLYAQWKENGSKSYSVMVISLIGGTAEADKSKGTEGETVRLSAKANKGYDFKEWSVEAGGVTLSDKTDANATFKIGTADVKVKAVFVKKDDPKPDPKPGKKDSDDDDDDHDDEPAPSNENNKKVPDECDGLRQNLSSAIATASVQGKSQTVYWSEGTSLPYDVMKMLQDNPKVTLVFSYTYQDYNYTVTIPGSAAIANPAVPWYGPVYLYALYGNTKIPALTTNTKATTGNYTVKSGDTLSAIAKRLKTTVKHLKEVNNIKDHNKIKPGMVLIY